MTASATGSASNWTLVPLSSIPPTAWRNGGGITRELAVWPAPNVKATQDKYSNNWLWRISVADVSADGPFSVFKGIDRWFAVLDGAGVQLDIQSENRATQSIEQTPNSEPLAFDGGAATDCKLIDGPTQDLNLMVRRSGISSSRMLRINGQLDLNLDASKFIAIYPINTPAIVDFKQHNEVKRLHVSANTLAWLNADSNQIFRIDSANALWMEIPQ